MWKVLLSFRKFTRLFQSQSVASSVLVQFLLSEDKLGCTVSPKHPRMGVTLSIRLAPVSLPSQCSLSVFGFSSNVSHVIITSICKIISHVSPKSVPMQMTSPYDLPLLLCRVLELWRQTSLPPATL